jgi:hypothetical protein
MMCRYPSSEMPLYQARTDDVEVNIHAISDNTCSFFYSVEVIERNVVFCLIMLS